MFVSFFTSFLPLFLLISLSFLFLGSCYWHSWVQPVWQFKRIRQFLLLGPKFWKKKIAARNWHHPARSIGSFRSLGMKTDMNCVVWCEYLSIFGIDPSRQSDSPTGCVETVCVRSKRHRFRRRVRGREKTTIHLFGSIYRRVRAISW